MIQEIHGWPQTSYEAINQWDNWKNLLDMCNAIRYGFIQYRLPTPGQSIDIKEAQERVKHIDKEWEREYQGRGNKAQKPCPDFSQCSIEAQCYFHSILEKTNEPDISEQSISELDFPY